jgi:hypothetical protein
MVDPRVLTSLGQLIFKLKLCFFLFYKTTYLNEEDNRTDPSPSVSLPWYEGLAKTQTQEIKMIENYIYKRKEESRKMRVWTKERSVGQQRQRIEREKTNSCERRSREVKE